MTKGLAGLLVLATSIALMAPPVTGQTGPSLAGYYAELPAVVVDPDYVALGVHGFTEDLNGDGHQDLIVLGYDFPNTGEPCCGVPQPGRVLLGDGDGRFALAPPELFPVDTLASVLADILFADFNADGRQDLFIVGEGWDRFPAPGQQNRLYLSDIDGTFRDATDTLPQISDATRLAAAGDISGRGLVDIFVGNSTTSLSLSNPYTLLNNGSGSFTQTTTNIPVRPDEFLDVRTQHNFAGATLTDLDGDGLPELIIGSDGRNRGKILRTTILWNRAGTFVETDMTELPVSGIFTRTHVDSLIGRIDVNQDGRPDLVLIGTQGSPLNDGWFVQILINRGARQFVDETAERVAAGDASAGTEGVREGQPYGRILRVLDFNADGAPDFSVEYNGGTTGQLAQDQPVIWLNDGAGHFSALRIRDFVAPGREFLIGYGHLVATRHGFSFITQQRSNARLSVMGVLATRPYRTTPLP